MRRIETEILVIGGGGTGVGIAWDAALRGFGVVLVEQRDLTHGTTGRFHGLLHSGARYAVKDPQSATECILENRILRRTHTHCIEDTGGLFVVTPEDEGDYPDRFLAACRATGVPCREISAAEALRREPLLNPRLSRAFEVPDGSVDGFLATHATAQAAVRAGAQVLTYHEVVGLLVAGGDGDRRVLGARVRDLACGDELEIHAALTVNAAGAWAGQLARMAGLTVQVIPGKGALLAMNHRVVNTVINRCRMPADGDIIVPAHTVAVVGTTDRRVESPEALTVEPWEVRLLVEEADKLLPGIAAARVVRAWAGVRPLYEEHQAAAPQPPALAALTQGTGPTTIGAGRRAGATRDTTRAFTLLDHRTRDGVAGLLTIIGGKWTTFRLMAEKAVDKACEQLGDRKPCATATTPVPGAERGYYWLGHRLHEVEAHRLQGELICECELVTRAMLENALRANPALTLDDLRRDLRLGKGPCQGGFCTYRAAGVMHELACSATPGRSREDLSGVERATWNVAQIECPATPARPSGDLPGVCPPPSDLWNPNLLLRDFLQERWKGARPVLWGQQMVQERFDELIYLSLMNADHLPDDELCSPMTGFYES